MNRSWKFYFKEVYEIKADKDEGGEIKEDAPQGRYENSEKVGLHNYGYGTFCHFSVNASKRAGTYILAVNGKPYYVGECVDLYKRFNSGYGNISPRNCYKGGQPTNCRINKNILKELKNRNIIKLYFYENRNRKEIETELITNLNTRGYWNK